MEGNTLTPTKRCSNCGEHKPVTEFYKNKARVDGYQNWCRKCSRLATAKSKQKNPTLSIFQNKRAGAKARNIEFSLGFSDVHFPEYCPALGFKLNYERCVVGRTSASFDSPSFDRIDPTKGYVKGNVIVVSNLANQIKTNATVDQLKKVAAFYDQLVPQIGG